MDNKLQDVTITFENIVRCRSVYEDDNRIDAILSFNGEECFIGISKPLVKRRFVNKLLSDKDRDMFTLEKAPSMSSCFSRLGTE